MSEGLEWLPQRPERGLFNDSALLVLIIPGTLLTLTVALGQRLPVRDLLLVTLIDGAAIAFVLLYARYLNRLLRYRLSERAVEVRGLRGWFGYPRAAIKEVRLEPTFEVDLYGNRWGLNSISGMALGKFRVDPFGWAQFHGYAGAGEAVCFKLEDREVFLTPEQPHDFLAHLLAFRYAVEAKPAALTEKE